MAPIEPRAARNEHARRVGRNLRGLLNDLKRDPAAAAKDLGISGKEIEAYLEGAAEIPLEVVARAVEVWPVNERDFFLVHDDAPAGVRRTSAAESKASSRVFDRAGAPYYEYRDTAMSRIAMFRPEWIEELRVVEDDDPENPAVQWNNGHFLHQFTYFIGPVNFYYMEEGRKRVAVMNTGDSMYITPYVPHTFTTRANPRGERGLILAVTCGGKIAGDPQQELSAIGPRWALEHALDFTTRERAFGSLLGHFRRNATLDVESLARLADLAPGELSALESGTRVPSPDVVTRLAAALRIHARDLMPPDELPSRVIVENSGRERRWDFPSGGPAYRVKELATTSILPEARPLELTVLKGPGDRVPDLRTGLHQWCYNVSAEPITLLVGRDGGVDEHPLGPGDSIYVKPFVEHAFRAANPGAARVLVMRLGGKMSGEAMRELSVIGRASAERAMGETMQWYDPKGRR